MLFLNAGTFKDAPFLRGLPVDFTALMAAICAALCVLVVAWNPAPFRRGFSCIMAMFLAFLPSVLWTDWSEYATRKVMALYTLTLLACVAPLVLVRTRADIKALFATQGAFAVVLAAVALSDIAPGARFERLTALSCDTITFGRTMATSGLWFAALLVTGHRRNRFWLLGGLVLMTVMCVAAGSRGALFLYCSGVVLTSLSGAKSGRTKRTLLITCAMAVALVVGLQFAPEQSRWRITAYLDGSSRDSGRSELFSLGRAAGTQSFLGEGWGASQNWNPAAQTGRFYFHNILMELVLEAGWIAALVFVWVFCQSVRDSARMARLTRYAEDICLTGWLCFYGMGACMSGDVNDNRWLFALIGIGLSIRQISRPAPGSTSHPTRQNPGSWAVPSPASSEGLWPTQLGPARLDV